MIIVLLIIVSITIVIMFIGWYAIYYKNEKVMQQCCEDCKIDRYEKKYFRELGKWQIIDRLNDSQPIVIIYDLPKDIGEEIIDYSLKLIEEKRK